MEQVVGRVDRARSENNGEIQKFHGESESDNQNIDLYRKTIKNDEKTWSKWGSLGRYILGYP